MISPWPPSFLHVDHSPHTARPPSVGQSFVHWRRARGEGKRGAGEGITLWSMPHISSSCFRSSFQRSQPSCLLHFHAYALETTTMNSIYLSIILARPIQLPLRTLIDCRQLPCNSINALSIPLGVPRELVGGEKAEAVVQTLWILFELYVNYRYSRDPSKSVMFILFFIQRLAKLSFDISSAKLSQNCKSLGKIVILLHISNKMMPIAVRKILPALARHLPAPPW